MRRPGPLADRILARGRELAGAPGLPDKAAFAELVARAQTVLDAEPAELRPRDPAGLPGGILALPDGPVYLVPDLHGRVGFLAAVLAWKPGPSTATVAELLESGAASLCCLGDAFHTETGAARVRWGLASEEGATGWTERRAMDEEMSLALSTVTLILETKLAFPRSFHYLKGNHDNIANEEGAGDHPFYKYAEEGALVASWFEEVYGGELRRTYRRLETSLPILALGRRFVASHGEPAFPLTREGLLDYRRRPEVVEALIWTANGEARPDAVARSLDALIPGTPALWFAGHRPVQGKFALRAQGLFVQFHNPERWPVASLRPDVAPDPDRDIVFLD